MSDPKASSIGILGSGAAGLITGEAFSIPSLLILDPFLLLLLTLAYTLLRDGFTNVTIISRDSKPGGVWSDERVYPGLTINKCVFFPSNIDLFYVDVFLEQCLRRIQILATAISGCKRRLKEVVGIRNA